MLLGEGTFDEIVRDPVDDPGPGDAAGTDFGAYLFLAFQDQDFSAVFCQQGCAGKTGRAGAADYSVIFSHQAYKKTC